MDKQKFKQIVKKHNRIYYHSERVIQRAIFSLIGSFRGRLTARRVAEKAGLSRQTIYNHYPNIQTAITESEKAIIYLFPKELEQQRKRLSAVIPDANTRLFYATLVFMAHRRELFCLICADDNNQRVLQSMIELLCPKLEIIWLPKGSPTPTIDTQRAKMLIKVLSEVICEWCVFTNCDVQKANSYIRRLLRATEDAAMNRLP